jgi:glyoxylase-like metal-dependent hydrolase (beta-lactamase superfamily II)
MVGSDYVIEPVVSQPFGQNSYVAWLRGRDDALVVDPGFEPNLIADVLEREKKRVAVVLLTHGHADHIAGNRAMREYAPEAPILIGRNEAALLTDPKLNLSATYGLPLTSPPADRLLDDGERVELAGIAFVAREVPGHSPGSIVLIADEFDPPFAFVGDVLFAGSVGRTDFPGGSSDQLLRGIRAHLFTLPDSTLVLPGHGPATTIGAEKRSNPFVGEAAGRFGAGW